MNTTSHSLIDRLKDKCLITGQVTSAAQLNSIPKKLTRTCDFMPVDVTARLARAPARAILCCVLPPRSVRAETGLAHVASVLWGVERCGVRNGESCRISPRVTQDFFNIAA